VADLDLTQAEADALIAMPKVRADDERHDYPCYGESINVPLTSQDKREQFLLDISRARLNLQKGTYQNRARRVVVLVRLDFGGSPHRNPDDQEVASPHLHLYREGFGYKWAFPVPTNKFHDLGDPWQTLQDFMAFCNVIEPPDIERGLFT
jgi:hypothetical protein